MYIIDTEGRLLVQKRTMKKDHYPGYYDLASGGVVGESDGGCDDTNAIREVEEELGLVNA